MHSEQIDKIMEALAKAQGQIKGASKDSSNPHFRSKYADLASVWDACREPLSSNGLAITQSVVREGESLVLVTMLGHTSGQWIKSFMPLPIQKPGSQELGSCVSYCRRYSLASLVGVYQEDDDGEEAQKQYRKPSPKVHEMEFAPSPAETILANGGYASGSTITPDMLKVLEVLFSEDKEGEEIMRKKFPKGWGSMSVADYGGVVNFMKNRKKSKQ